MARELTLTTNLQFDNGQESVKMGVNNLSIDVTGDNYVRLNANIGQTEEEINIGAATQFGYIHAINKSRSGTVWYRSEAGGANAIEVGPGEAQCWRIPPGASPRFVASEDDVELEYLLIED